MTRSSSRARQDPRGVLETLGRNVRTCRRERGLTQLALAERLELSVGYVSLIERGGRNPPFTTVIAIARALGVTPGEIVRE